MDIRYGSGLLVILGAGASFDSVCGGEPVTPPPMTAGLVEASALTNRILDRYPQASPIVDHLRRRIGQNPEFEEVVRAVSLEQALEEYVASRNTRPHVLNQIMAFRLYLRDLLEGCTQSVLGGNGQITNYTLLVRKCYEWALERQSKVCFVTFNYDTLLDRACAIQFGFVDHCPELLGFTDPHVAYLLKPHGSITWAWPHPAGHNTVSNDAIIAAGEPAETVQAEPRFVGNGASPTTLLGLGVSAFPALALPVINKTSLVWPREQHELFTSGFPNGSFGRVLIAGWQAAEPHFAPLLNRLVPDTARVTIITGGDEVEAKRANEAVKDRLRGGAVKSSTGIVPYSRGFDSALRNGVLDALLDGS
jgi:hypothetical protein